MNWLPRLAARSDRDELGFRVLVTMCRQVSSNSFRATFAGSEPLSVYARAIELAHALGMREREAAEPAQASGARFKRGAAGAAAEPGGLSVRFRSLFLGVFPRGRRALNVATRLVLLAAAAVRQAPTVPSPFRWTQSHFCVDSPLPCPVLGFTHFATEASSHPQPDGDH